MNMKSFDEIFVDKTKYGTKIKTSEYMKSGKHIIVDQGQEDIAGYTDMEDGVFTDVPTIIFGDHTRIIKYVDKPFFLGADGVKVLKSKDRNANYRYLYYALSNVKIPNTGYNRHFKWLKESEFYYHDYEQQIKIVNILDKLTDLIGKRKKQLEKLDELVKSRFVEMFGDTITNPYRFEESAVKERCKMTQGVQIPMSEQLSDYKEGYYRYLYIRDLKYDDDNWIYVRDCFDEKKLTESDLVVVNTGNTAGEIYRGKKGILSNNLFKVSFDTKELSTTYLFYYFRSEAFQNLLWSEMKEGTQPHLGHKIFGSKKLVVPPMKLQNQFEAFVEQTDKSKFVVQQALEKAQLLFDSLMQQYFG